MGLLVGAGVILVAAGLVVVGAGDDLHRKMPVQVPPRRLAAIPLAAGAALLALAGALALLP